MHDLVLQLRFRFQVFHIRTFFEKRIFFIKTPCHMIKEECKKTS